MDLEAEVSDEGEEGEEVDDDDDLKNDSFLESGDEDDGRYHVQLDKRRLEEDKISLEDIARQLTERYNPRLPSHFTGDTNEIPQRLLMPDIHDPGLWRISVKVISCLHPLIYIDLLSSLVANEISYLV